MRRTPRRTPTEPTRPSERPARRLLEKQAREEDAHYRRLRELYRGQPIDNAHEEF